MRVLTFLSVFCLALVLNACSSGGEINGRTLKTANRSVSYIKNRLPVEKRIEFEVSYWTIKDDSKSNEDFLDRIDGNSADELIEIGREIFQQRKNAGFTKYDDYESWDQMITQFTQERIDQDRKRPDKRDQANNVLYNL